VHPEVVGDRVVLVTQTALSAVAQAAQPAGRRRERGAWRSWKGLVLHPPGRRAVGDTAGWSACATRHTISGWTAPHTEIRDLTVGGEHPVWHNPSHARMTVPVGARQGGRIWNDKKGPRSSGCAPCSAAGGQGPSDHGTQMLVAAGGPLWRFSATTEDLAGSTRFIRRLGQKFMGEFIELFGGSGLNVERGAVEFAVR